jgi:hypothetical protein
MSSCVFTWYALYFIGFCFKVLATFNINPSRPVWAETINSILDLGYLNLWMALLAIIASYVNETSNRSKSVVHRYLSVQSRSTSNQSARCRHLSHLLSLSQYKPEICFTGGGAFEMNKRLLVAVWGSVATYLLFVISWRVGVH